MTSKTAPRKSKAKSGARRRRTQQQTRGHESRLAVLEAYLQRRTSITINGEAKQVSAGDAILLQLLQKALAGDARSMGALLQYLDFAGKRSSKSPELRFPESDYTRSFSKSTPGGTDE